VFFLSLKSLDLVFEAMKSPGEFVNSLPKKYFFHIVSLLDWRILVEKLFLFLLFNKNTDAYE